MNRVQSTPLTITDVARAAHDITGMEQDNDVQDELIQRFVRTFEPEELK